MTDTEIAKAAAVVDALAAAVALALEAGFDADEIIDTVGAMVGLGQH